MGIMEDIKTIKSKQEEFRTKHGEYFEIQANPSDQLPKIGDDLKISSLERFITDKSTAKNIKSVPFIPTAKDYQFMVGVGIYYDAKGAVEGRVYMITAMRQLDDRIVEILTVKDGDEGYRDDVNG